MPYRSEKQRRFMHAKHPEIAARWDKTYGGTVRKSDGYGSNQVGRRITELDEFEKGVLHQGVVRPIARRGGTARRFVTGDQNSRRIIGKSAQGNKWVLEDVEKISLNGIRTGFKNTWGVARGGFKSGLAQSRGVTGAAAKPKMGLGASTAAANSPMLQRVGSFAQTAGRNPLATGAVAGAGLGAGGTSMMGGRRQSMYAPPQPMYSGYAKRSYDPEDERRFRQGAYAAGTGIAGVGLTASGVRGVRRDTQAARDAAGAVQGHARQVTRQHVPPPLAVRMHQVVDDPAGAKYRSGPRKGQPKKVRVPTSGPELVRDAERAKAREGVRQSATRQNEHIDALRGHTGDLRGKVVSGRSAGKLAGGVALLGTSGALLRSRHEDRWN